MSDKRSYGTDLEIFLSEITRIRLSELQIGINQMSLEKET